MTKKTSENKVQQALTVCNLYYQDNLSQNDIAKRLGLSRPTISRLLQFAREEGLVRIEISNPFNEIDHLSNQLAKKYQLKKVIIAFDASNNAAQITDKLGQATANYLDQIIQDDDRIGISWGKTLDAVANYLKPSHSNNVSIVQLKGSVSDSQINTFAGDITERFSRAFHTQAVTLPLPVIFDSAITKDIVVKDRFIHQIIQKQLDTNIAIFTCGTVHQDALLFKLDYLKEEEIKRLQTLSVGDVLSQFITSDGQIADPSINERTVSLPIPALREKEYSILVGGSSRKLHAIHGALIGKYANVLITDYRTGCELVKM